MNEAYKENPNSFSEERLVLTGKRIKFLDQLDDKQIAFNTKTLYINDNKVERLTNIDQFVNLRVLNAS